MKERYLKINQDLVDELIVMCLEGKEFYGVRKCGLMISSKLNVDMNINVFENVMDWNDERRIRMIITVPKYFHEDNFCCNNFYRRLIVYIKNTFNVSMKRYANTINCTEEQAVFLFCTLHEIGHSISNMKDYKKYKAFKTYYESQGAYETVNFKMKKFRDVFEEYRKIPNEYKADKEAIRLMEKYKEQIKDIMTKGYIQEYNLNQKQQVVAICN